MKGLSAPHTNVPGNEKIWHKRIVPNIAKADFI